MHQSSLSNWHVHYALVMYFILKNADAENNTIRIFLKLNFSRKKLVHEQNKKIKKHGSFKINKKDKFGSTMCLLKQVTQMSSCMHVWAHYTHSLPLYVLSVISAHTSCSSTLPRCFSTCPLKLHVRMRDGSKQKSGVAHSRHEQPSQSTWLYRVSKTTKQIEMLIALPNSFWRRDILRLL